MILYDICVYIYSIITLFSNKPIGVSIHTSTVLKIYGEKYIAA